MPIFDFYCAKCDELFDEFIQSHRMPNPVCPKCESKTERTMSTPAFTFKGGYGGDGGLTMRLPGHRVPNGHRNSKMPKPEKKLK